MDAIAAVFEVGVLSLVGASVLALVLFEISDAVVDRQLLARGTRGAAPLDPSPGLLPHPDRGSLELPRAA